MTNYNQIPMLIKIRILLFESIKTISNTRPTIGTAVATIALLIIYYNPIVNANWTEWLNIDFHASRLKENWLILIAVIVLKITKISKLSTRAQDEDRKQIESGLSLTNAIQLIDNPPQPTPARDILNLIHTEASKILDDHQLLTWGVSLSRYYRGIQIYSAVHTQAISDDDRYLMQLATWEAFKQATPIAYDQYINKIYRSYYALPIIEQRQHSTSAAVIFASPRPFAFTGKRARLQIKLAPYIAMYALNIAENTAIYSCKT